MNIIGPPGDAVQTVPGREERTRRRGGGREREGERKGESSRVREELALRDQRKYERVYKEGRTNTEKERVGLNVSFIYINFQHTNHTAVIS